MPSRRGPPCFKVTSHRGSTSQTVAQQQPPPAHPTTTTGSGQWPVAAAHTHHDQTPQNLSEVVAAGAHQHVTRILNCNLNLNSAARRTPVDQRATITYPSVRVRVRVVGPPPPPMDLQVWLTGRGRSSRASAPAPPGANPWATFQNVDPSDSARFVLSASISLIRRSSQQTLPHSRRPPAPCDRPRNDNTILAFIFNADDARVHHKYLHTHTHTYTRVREPNYHPTTRATQIKKGGGAGGMEDQRSDSPSLSPRMAPQRHAIPWGSSEERKKEKQRRGVRVPYSIITGKGTTSPSPSLGRARRTTPPYVYHETTASAHPAPSRPPACTPACRSPTAI
ncbi:hypothetical protein BC628DRAFT_91321 [Trametes gibbosa]|nr:hypothetical protein BC628DRAFT_91321 [Trametes gibbosa]